jgi:uncharacterized protein (DUF2225 family)
MTMLTDKIRQMNALLVAADRPEEAAPPEEVHEVMISRDAVRLLPEGYVPFNVTDDRDIWGSLRELNTVCPHCRKELVVFAPTINHMEGKRDILDGRVTYGNINILYYTNIICPNCNYADTYVEFSKPRQPRAQPLYQGNQFHNKENFAGFADIGNRTLDEVIMSYYLSIDCLERTVKDPLKLANAWIRLYWLYSDQKNEYFMKQSAKYVFFYYSKYYNSNIKMIPLPDKMRLNAILGEMSAVLGDYEQAFKYHNENTVIGKGTKNDLAKESARRCKEVKRMM